MQGRLWEARVTTVFVPQGTYAHDPKVIGAYPAADVTFERIGDLLDCDLPQLRSALCVRAPPLESMQWGRLITQRGPVRASFLLARSRIGWVSPARFRH
jgi:hypothetical protein